MVRKQNEQEYVSIRDLSEQLDISFYFLTKILQTLTQANLLVSYRGPNGGIAFKVPPEKIMLSDVVRVLEGSMSPKCAFHGSMITIIPKIKQAAEVLIS
ncbi:MAG: Rrf2 family transcriptional regulator [Saprospirales bacterium]|nr:Rrf2 family transcriptional regulator [Saprospirales bacterium]